MNIYVVFSTSTMGFLNLKPSNPVEPSFTYYRLDDHKLVTHTDSFNNYVDDIINSRGDVANYFFTPASTIDELYALHPELLI